MEATTKIEQFLKQEGFKVISAGHTEHNEEVTSYSKGTEEITIISNKQEKLAKDYRDFQTEKENVSAGSVYNPKIADIAFNCMKKVSQK